MKTIPQKYTLDPDMPLPAGVVWVVVEFGERMPDGTCVHTGICNITPADPGFRRTGRPARCRSAFAMYKPLNGRGCTLFFPSARMLPCTERALFRQKYFELKTAWAVPPPVLALAGQPPPVVIPAGRFLIRRVRGGYRIDFWLP